MEDEPYSLGQESNREARRGRLARKHVLPLEQFAKKLRATRPESKHVPSFDPDDAGNKARVLLLLEAPGPKAVESGFVSRNNPDPTARNLFRLLQDAELPRSVTAVWNVIPWYLGSGKKIRPAKAADLEAAKPWLLCLLSQLPHLREIVLVGKKAQRARESLSNRRDLRLTDCPHPSNQVFNRWPEKRLETCKELRAVARRLTLGAADASRRR